MGGSDQNQTQESRSTTTIDHRDSPTPYPTEPATSSAVMPSSGSDGNTRATVTFGSRAVHVRHRQWASRHRQPSFSMHVGPHRRFLRTIDNDYAHHPRFRRHQDFQRTNGDHRVEIRGRSRSDHQSSYSQLIFCTKRQSPTTQSTTLGTNIAH